LFRGAARSSPTPLRRARAGVPAHAHAPQGARAPAAARRRADARAHPATGTNAPHSPSTRLPLGASYFCLVTLRFPFSRASRRMPSSLHSPTLPLMRTKACACTRAAELAHAICCCDVSGPCGLERRKQAGIDGEDINGTEPANALTSERTCTMPWAEAGCGSGKGTLLGRNVVLWWIKCLGCTTNVTFIVSRYGVCPKIVAESVPTSCANSWPILVVFVDTSLLEGVVPTSSSDEHDGFEAAHCFQCNSTFLMHCFFLHSSGTHVGLLKVTLPLLLQSLAVLWSGMARPNDSSPASSP